MIRTYTLHGGVMVTDSFNSFIQSLTLTLLLSSNLGLGLAFTSYSYNALTVTTYRLAG